MSDATNEITEMELNGRTFRARSQAFPNFWQAMADGRWEASTLRIFDAFIDSQTVVLDIGAWMGPTTLYAAPVAAQVLSFEPDPVAFDELSRNIGLNVDQPWAGRIDAVNQAIAPQSGVMRLGSKEGLGVSTSSLLYHDEENSVEVDVIAFDQLADDPRVQGKKIFVKMDIEGAEYDLLVHPSRILAQPDSVLCLSLHPRILRRRNRADSGRSPLAMLRRRFKFVSTHWKLLRTLPYRYLYTADGERLSLAGQMLQALILGKFEREIVATHQPWDGTAHA